jgi:multidrug efflux pump subunit AcrB
MELVKYALKFRATFFVASIMVLFLGAVAIKAMPKDVFPNVDIPVVTMIWSYTGLPTQEMERRITTFSEFGLSNNVNGIRNIESQTLPGVAVVKIYFQPDVNLELAIAQVVSNTNSIRTIMPTGINAPIVVRYSASSVPVIQLALRSDTLSEQQLVDFAQIRVRQAITQVPGSTLPSPFGGRPRQIQVDLDPARLQALGLTAQDVTAAISAQNLTLPSGQAKVGDTQFPVRINASTDTVVALNDLPIRMVGGTPVLVRDVASVRDAGPPQVNIVRADGGRSVLISILKNGNASTLDMPASAPLGGEDRHEFCARLAQRVHAAGQRQVLALDGVQEARAFENADAGEIHPSLDTQRQAIALVFKARHCHAHQALSFLWNGQPARK